MFLSKLKADRKRWDVIHDIEDRDSLHKKVLRYFMTEISIGGHESVRRNLGILFRVEHDMILMQSKVAPNPARKIAGYEFVGSKNIEENYQAIGEGRIFRFRLDANTSILEPKGGAMDWIPEDSNVQTQVKLHRVGCGNYPARARWFESMASRWGFWPERYSMDTMAMLKAKLAMYETTRFEGAIKVSHRNRFLRCLQEGIGQGKSYGLGMLSIRNA